MNSPATWNRTTWIGHVERVLVEAFILYANTRKSSIGQARFFEYKHDVLHPKLVDVLTHPTPEDFNKKTALDAAMRRGRTRGELLDHGLSEREAEVFWKGVKKAAAGVVSEKGVSP